LIRRNRLSTELLCVAGDHNSLTARSLFFYARIDGRSHVHISQSITRLLSRRQVETHEHHWDKLCRWQWRSYMGFRRRKHYVFGLFCSFIRPILLSRYLMNGLNNF